MTVNPGILLLLLTTCGLLVGSFLGLVSLRLPAGRTIVFGRSQCADCGRPLAAWRLTPVLSWVVSRGRCSDCGAAIPLRYPLMEVASAAIGAIAALTQVDLSAALLTALLGWQLLLIAVVDGEHFQLPDALTLPLALTGLLAAVVLPELALHDSLIGMGVGFVGLWLIGRGYRALRGQEGLGDGDPFLLGAGGTWVGWISLPSVLLWASAAAFSVIVARLFLRRPVSGSDRMPFGVFLAVGIACVWLTGPLGL